MEDGTRIRKQTPDFLRRYGAWTLLALCLVGLLPGTGQMPLLDRDEPRFSQATVEMMHGENRNWLIPYFNGGYRFDKPILTYWMMRADYLVLGITEFAARFHSVLSTIFLVLFLYYTGRRWMGDLAGLMAGGIMLFSLQTLIHGRVAVADLPMVLAVAVAQVSIYELMYGNPPHPRRWFWSLYLSLAFGFLAKGPIAWLVPAISLLILRFALRVKAPAAWRSLRPFTGLPVTIGIVALWGVPALMVTKGAFWDVGVGHHVVERGVDTFNQRTFIPGVYLGTAFLSLFPWTVFLPHAISDIREMWSTRTKFLVAWLLSPYLVFSFYATQLPHYVMPAFPAFALLLGPAISHRLRESRFQRGWRRTLTAAYTVPILLLLVASVTVSFPDAFSGMRYFLMGASIAAGSVLMGANLLFARRWRPLVPLLLAFLLGFSLVGYGMRSVAVSPKIAAAFSQVSTRIPCAFWLYTEPSTVFYSKCRWDHIQSEEDALKFVSQPGPRAFLMLRQETDSDDLINHQFARMLRRSNELKQKHFSLDPATRAILEDGAFELHTIEGLNIGKSSAVKLDLWIRHE